METETETEIETEIQTETEKGIELGWRSTRLLRNRNYLNLSPTPDVLDGTRCYPAIPSIGGGQSREDWRTERLEALRSIAVRRPWHNIGMKVLHYRRYEK